MRPNALSGKTTPTNLKSFDFVVYSEAGSNLLIDVKGRKHGGKSKGSRSANARFALILGGDTTPDQGTLKDMGTGEQQPVALADVTDAVNR